MGLSCEQSLSQIFVLSLSNAKSIVLLMTVLSLFFFQRARFKAVESLKDSKTRSVVVCTDVAARGLDIPSVATVVHYDVARSVDAFVHRSGRTAVSFTFLIIVVLSNVCQRGRDYQVVRTRVSYNFGVVARI